MASKHHDANVRRERGRTRRALAQDPEPPLPDCKGSWEAPPADQWETEPDYPEVLDLDGVAVQIIHRRETYFDELVDFALILQVRDGAGTWHEVIRYDCAHECVHRHRFARDGLRRD